MAILEVKNIEKHFGSTQVLKDVSFSMEEGSALAIIGSSGSGKTTLLRCLNFLETPNEGSITVKGETLYDASRGSSQNERELRKKRLHFGMVFQSFNLFPQYTALENVMLAEQLLAKERPDYNQNKKAILEEIHAHGEALLKKMGLEQRENHYPHQLSGGQQQRVAIARALAKNPKLLLCDEPTGALDYNTGKSVLKLLQSTCRDMGKTVVVITHNQALTAMADRVITVKSGTVVSMVQNETTKDVSVIEW